MIPAPFQYRRVFTVDEAIEALEHDTEAKLLLGGHSLLPLMKLRLARPSTLIDVAHVSELRTVDIEQDNLAIGAGVRYAEILGDTRLTEVMPVLRQSVSVIADPQVRHRSTIGGSAAHADPAADLPAVFLAAEARFQVRGPAGARQVPADQWFVAPLVSALGPEDVLISVHFSRPLPALQAYVKFPHPASGYALAGVAALLDLAANGRVGKARIAVTGAGVMPFRAEAAESALEGRPLDRDSIAAAARAGAEAGEYADDMHYSADYRKNLAEVMIRRALEKALQA